jgi:hypothetical protein
MSKKKSSKTSTPANAKSGGKGHKVKPVENDAVAALVETTAPAQEAAGEPVVATSEETQAASVPAEATPDATPTEPAANAPKATKRTKARNEPKPKKVSALDAAARVLAEAGKPMNCKEMIEAMAAKGYWSSPSGQTPAATLYSAMLREMDKKGEESRFKKSDRGTFERTGAA